MTGNLHKGAGIGILCAALFLSRPGVAQEVRVTRQIDANEKVVLVHGIHPRALAGLDQGKVADEFVLHGMVLEFGRTAQQQAALNQLLSAQQDRTSPEYHRWLTPEQFGDRFGVAQADITAIRLWLEKEGFQVDEVARARTYVRFSGTANQVRKSFSAEIHSFSVKGEKHFAPASSVSIPAALAPLVREVRNLDNFHLQAPRRKTQPLDYVGAGGQFIAPGDMATIYDFQSLRNQGYDGTGQFIVVVGQTDISLGDLDVYRSSYGLPAARVTIVTAGVDPGVSPDDVIESDLDLDVVSAVAPNATIVFVNAVSVIDSVQYAIDNNLAPVISMSYAGCEPLISAEPAATANVLESWAQQGNAEGITWIAASGDSGAAACDPFGYDAPYATYGLAVNLPASIPEVTGVGGTEFQSQTNDYWAVTTNANGGTAISYVPEEAWNYGFPSDPVASGGGASIDFAKPLWQVGSGVPSDGARDVPDVALLATNFVIGENGELSEFDASFSGQGVNGTSGSTPMFAGIVTLLNQYLAPFQPAQPGQGNINPTLYSLAQTTTAAFHDIVIGDNLWHCTGGLGCGGVNNELGYLAGPGYDQVTGLGSIDAYNLVHQWPTIAGQAPTVSTGLASVTFPSGTGATLAGDVNPNGSDTHAYFLYGTSASLAGASQTPSVDLGTGTTPSAFNASVSGLTVNTTYYFQLVATNTAGTASGSIVSFTTNPGGQLPIATTLSASAVTGTSATLSGSVIPNGSATHYWFAYGTDPTFASTLQTASVDGGSGNSMVSASADIAGLVPNQFYFFQLRASNSAGTASGSVMSFKTSSAGQPPAVSTGVASSITSNSAILGGTVNPNGVDTLYWFVLAVTGASASAQPQPIKFELSAGNQAISVSVPISGLAPNTPYTFQIVASSGAGTSAGNYGTFTTNASGQATSVTTGSTLNITSSSTTISGTINPNGKNTQYWFVYGESPTLNFAVKTSKLPAGSGSTPVPVSANLAGLQPGTYYYQLQALSSGGSINGSILSFIIPGPPVAVTSYSQCVIGGALFWGQINPNGADTQYWFAYGTNPTLSGAALTAATDAGSSPSHALVSGYVMNGLTPGTTYYFQLQASNQYGTSSSQILSFVQNLPVAITSPAVLGTTAGTSDLGEWTLYGNADPNGLDTHAWFLYGTSPTLSGAIQTYSEAVPYQRSEGSTLTGLMTNTTYYFQLVASNAAGTVKGAILSFKTASGPAQPSLTLNPASNLTGTSATLTGTVNPNSLPTTYVITYGPDSSAGPYFAASGSVGSGTTPVPVGGTVTGLVPGATYYYQLQASNSAPFESFSQILSFTEPIGCFSSLPNGSSIFLPADALPYSIQINGALAGCGGNAVSDQPWFTITNASSSGTWTLNYAVTLNNTGVDRTAHITVGSQQLTVTQDFTSAEFADVPPSSSYFDAANLMFVAGVTDGCVAGSTPSTRMFCPDESVTREEMAAFIVRAVTGTLTPATYNPVPLFTDVPATNPFFPHIQKMGELGITDGCATGLFCPTDTVPRYQMAIFLVRARLALYGASFSYNSTPYFTDVPVTVEGNTTTFPFIQRAYEEHITNGCGTNPLIYCPDDLVTRGEMASFIMRGLFNETTILGPTSPMVTGVSPSSMAATVGAQITVTITGVNTSFQAGDTVTVPSGMLAVSNVVVNSATSISATLTANSNVAAGPQALVVTSSGQNLTLPLAIQVGTY